MKPMTRKRKAAIVNAATDLQAVLQDLIEWQEETTMATTLERMRALRALLIDALDLPGAPLTEAKA